MMKLSAALLGGVVVAVMAWAPVQASGNGHAQKAKSSVHKLDQALRESLKRAPKPERVIIRMKKGYEGAMKNALEWHGDIVEKEHQSLGALTAIVHGEDLEAIANDAAVESVSKDHEVRASAAGRSKSQASSKSNGKAYGKTKNESKGTAHAKAKRPTKSSKTRKPKKQEEPKEILGRARQLQGLGLGAPTGKGVGIAIIDSGIELKGDFAGTVTAFYDFTRGDEPVYAHPYDDYGHGTHIASLIVNQGKDKQDYQGVAPGAHLIGLKVLDENGSGRTSDVIAAIEFATTYKLALDVDIINLSLGHPIFESAATDPLVIAVEKAHRAGIVVVASAGNFGMNPKTKQVGYGGVTSPGNAPSAITVGAVDTKNTVKRSDDLVAPFSSRGPTWIDGFAKPDVMAPGVGEKGSAAKGGKLYQTYPNLKFDDDDEGEFDEYKADEFASLSGTSMAAAEASGVVALVLEANHHLSPNAVKAVLEYTATPLTDQKEQPFDALTQGLGEVNGAGAISAARLIDTTAPEGAPWLGAHETSTVFDNETRAWSQNIVWGNYFVRGVDSLFLNSEAWDDNIVWGTLGEDENIVWGTFATDESDNIVWGNLAVWGSFYDGDQDNIVWGNFARDDENIVWGNVVQSDADGDGDLDNIVWGNSFEWDDNIVWGNSLLGVQGDDDNIVWGNLNDDNIVWGNSADDDNIVWGNLDDDNIVWGNSSDDDNIVWGNNDDGDNVVWGTAILLGLVK